MDCSVAVRVQSSCTWVHLVVCIVRKTAGIPIPPKPHSRCHSKSHPEFRCYAPRPTDFSCSTSCPIAGRVLCSWIHTHTLHSMLIQWPCCQPYSSASQTIAFKTRAKALPSGAASAKEDVPLERGLVFAPARSNHIRAQQPTNMAGQVLAPSQRYHIHSNHPPSLIQPQRQSSFGTSHTMSIFYE